MCNSVNNTYKKHLPVYIYKHSSLIEPVEITALQIIIIDPSEIHSPRLNILIKAGSHHSQKPKLAHAKTSKNLKSQTEVPKIWEHLSVSHWKLHINDKISDRPANRAVNVWWFW